MQLYKTSPLGATYHADRVFKDYTIGKTLPVDLVQLEIQGWDVILGTDWSAKYKGTLDCEKELITFLTLKERRWN